MSPAPQPRPWFAWSGGWLRSLLSILVGNAMYFIAAGYMPEAARHQPFAWDWGLLIDLWFCIAAYGIGCMVWPRKKPAAKS